MTGPTVSVLPSVPLTREANRSFWNVEPIDTAGWSWDFLQSGREVFSKHATSCHLVPSARIYPACSGPTMSI